MFTHPYDGSVVGYMKARDVRVGDSILSLPVVRGRSMSDMFDVAYSGSQSVWFADDMEPFSAKVSFFENVCDLFSFMLYPSYPVNATVNARTGVFLVTQWFNSLLVVKSAGGGPFVSHVTGEDCYLAERLRVKVHMRMEAHANHALPLVTEAKFRIPALQTMSVRVDDGVIIDNTLATASPDLQGKPWGKNGMKNLLSYGLMREIFPMSCRIEGRKLEPLAAAAVFGFEQGESSGVEESYDIRRFDLRTGHLYSVCS